MKVYDIEIDNGSKVRFRVHSQTDGQTYRGTVRGFVQFQGARIYEDLAAVHNSMIAEVAQTTLSAQTFLLLETADGKIRPFAFVWIDGNTLELEDTAADRLIVVRGVESGNVDLILNTIRTLGYDCSIYREGSN